MEPEPKLGPYFLRLGQLDAAVDLVKRFHYSHRPPSKVKLCATAHEPGGLFGDLGPAVAACTFSLAYGVWGGIHGEYPNLLELTRLVRRDDVQIVLTGLISWAVRWVRQLKLADLLISYADIQQHHHGGIYQAASWHYHGRRAAKVEGFTLPDRSVVPRRTVWSRERFQQQIPDIEFADKLDQGKHLYWKALTREGVRMAERFGLQRDFYPRPQRPADAPRRS